MSRPCLAGSPLKSCVAWLLALVHLLGPRRGVAGDRREMSRAGRAPGPGGAQLQRSLACSQGAQDPEPPWHSHWTAVLLLGHQPARAGPVWDPLVWGSRANRQQSCSVAEPPEAASASDQQQGGSSLCPLSH